MQASVELPKEGQRINADNANGSVKLESAAQELSEPQTPTTSILHSDADSTQPTTPSSTSKSQSKTRASQPAIPLAPIPVVPNVPATSRPHAKDGSSVASETPKSAAATPAEVDFETTSVTEVSESSTKQTSPVRAPPKSWADLVRSKAYSRPADVPSPESGLMTTRKSESLSDVLNSLGDDVSQYSDKIAFLEPRGLVNTGNMCYMNSVCSYGIDCR